MDRFPDTLVLETLAALNRNLDELYRLQAEDVPDPVAIARIQNARSKLNRAKGLVRKLADRQ